MGPEKHVQKIVKETEIGERQQKAKKNSSYIAILLQQQLVECVKYIIDR